MRKLLSANFSRLRIDKIFWLGLLAMFGLGAYVVCSMYSNTIRYNEYAFLGDSLLIYSYCVGGCAAIFCSFFFGTEYSNGTIRNKLIVGHKRGNIYCAGLFLSVFTALLMGIAFLLSYFVLGSFLLEAPKLPMNIMIFYNIISFFTIIAYASIFHMLSMLISRKSVSVLVCLLTFFGLFILAMVIIGKLDAPEFISGYQLTANGLEQTAPEPNPRYLQPEARRIYQFFDDLLPTCQSLTLSYFEVIHPVLMIVYSVIISVVTTIIGVLGFQRKNLK